MIRQSRSGRASGRNIVLPALDSQRKNRRIRARLSAPAGCILVVRDVWTTYDQAIKLGRTMLVTRWTNLDNVGLKLDDVDDALRKVFASNPRTDDAPQLLSHPRGPERARIWQARSMVRLIRTRVRPTGVHQPRQVQHRLLAWLGGLIVVMLRARAQTRSGRWGPASGGGFARFG